MKKLIFAILLIGLFVTVDAEIFDAPAGKVFKVTNVGSGLPAPSSQTGNHIGTVFASEENGRKILTKAYLSCDDNREVNCYKLLNGGTQIDIGPSTTTPGIIVMDVEIDTEDAGSGS